MAWIVDANIHVDFLLELVLGIQTSVSSTVATAVSARDERCLVIASRKASAEEP